MRDVLMAFYAHACRTPDRPALIDDQGILSYGDLLRDVEETAAWAAVLPSTVGLAAPRDRRGLVWLLALAWAGRTIVPLPDFFSASQIAHVAADAAIGAVLAPAEAGSAVAAAGLPPIVPGRRPAVEGPSGDARWIVYTSGTTGRPKGVMLGARQMEASIVGLAESVAANPADRMLSVLPFALLLEQIAGLLLPLRTGASIGLCRSPADLPAAAEAFAPTVTVLVPELLAGWVGWLEAAGRRAPASLRFVAVGGAPVPPALADRAWAAGLPVHEGYGLSECCSVVAVNRPGERRRGTVGRPLSGLSVHIEAGEIVVEGPTVMDGYLGRPGVEGRWQTGDAGHFDEAGCLVIDGRLDDVIVTTTGRNIHPAWIEAMILADPRVARCAVVDGGPFPRALLVPRHGPSLGTDCQPDDLVAALCSRAPDYARPRKSVVISEDGLRQRDLITANGRLRRAAIATFLKDSA